MIVRLDATRSYCVMPSAASKAGSCAGHRALPVSCSQSKMWVAGTSPAMTECYFNVARPRRRPRLAFNASHPHAADVCRWGNDISARFVRCRFATANKIDSVFSVRLWNAQWKPRIPTIAATNHLQLRARGGCVFCLQQGGSVASGCPLAVGRTVLA
jgi:hypothetical protein